MQFGVFALPVTANFLISHQWVREIKRRGFRSAVGVYFQRQLPAHESEADPRWSSCYCQWERHCRHG